MIPAMNEEYDMGKTPIKPISAANEQRALMHLATICLVTLNDYPTTLKQDVELLQGGTLAPFSNERNCVVVRK